MKLRKGDRVVHTINGSLGLIVDVHVDEGMTIEAVGGPLYAGAVSYSVVWDGTNQPDTVDGEQLRRA
jgi:hypothetical protein